jgi:hypothetical protein
MPLPAPTPAQGEGCIYVPLPAPLELDPCEAGGTTDAKEQLQPRAAMPSSLALEAPENAQGLEEGARALSQ